MSRLVPTLVLAVAALLLAIAAPAAHATHLEECRPYTTPTSPMDEIEVEGVIIGLRLVKDELDASAETLEIVPLVGPALAAPVRVAAATASASEFAARVAALTLYGINREADECRGDAHARMLDDLLSAQIRRDLGSTTTPVALFVLPESEGGYLDTEGVGVKVIVRDAIDRMKSSGQCTCSAAESSYSQAVSALGSGNYKTAHRLFRQAYVYAFSG
jgi:hypothetical protein